MVFRITYGTVTRELTQAQLQKAPDSQLATTLLTDATTRSGTLLIRSDRSPAAWAQGNEELFKIAISCYTGKSEEIVHPPTAQQLQEALVGYFNIPEHMQPLGLRLTKPMVSLVDRIAEKEERVALALLERMYEVMQSLCTDTERLGNPSPEHDTDTLLSWTVSFVVRQGSPNGYHRNLPVAVQTALNTDSRSQLMGVYVGLESKNAHSEANEYMTSGLQRALVKVSKMHHFNLEFGRLHKCNALIKATVYAAVG